MAEYYRLDLDSTAQYYVQTEDDLYQVSYDKDSINDVDTSTVSSGVELHDEAEPIDKSEIPDTVKEEFRDKVDI